MKSYGIWSKGGHYVTYRHCDWGNLTADLSSNDNQGFLFNEDPESKIASKYWLFQDSKFHDFTSYTGLGSLYSTQDLLVENCEFYRGINGIGSKREVDQITIRQNIFHDLSSSAMGDAMNSMWRESEDIEICFNLFYNMPGAALLNNFRGDGLIQGKTFIYRNTILGKVGFRWLGADMPISGPFFVYNNIILNSNLSDSNKLVCETGECTHCPWSNPSCPITPYESEYNVFSQENLVGALAGSGIVDGDYQLTPAYQNFKGSRGWQTTSLPTRNIQHPRLPEKSSEIRFQLIHHSLHLDLPAPGSYEIGIYDLAGTRLFGTSLVNPEHEPTLELDPAIAGKMLLVAVKGPHHQFTGKVLATD